MDNQYKLTDRVSKDSIKSPIFKKWVKRILCIVFILSLALQLTLCCMPMKASAAENDSVVGTWILNPTLSIDSLSSSINVSSGDVQSYAYFGGNLVLTDVVSISYSTSFNPTRYQILVSFGSSTFANRLYSTSSYGAGLSEDYVQAVNGSTSPSTSLYLKDSDNGLLCRTLIVNDDSSFSTGHKSWLISNATKLVTDIYDFTGETRIFNDELTLFNTSDATWVESFSFDFEVLGVGTADYLSLQRTSQNWYTMSYAFDFEGSGGLIMIYRDTPPFNDDDANWLGGKVNRKVITFLSNPEDPEFQQWLLDNTTLFDNVNDAYELGQQSGYNNGYEEGFANSLIGDTLSGPINALSQITLIEIQGTAITLGGVVMTAIALCLVLAFLKLYAGG